jgi:Holliday junction DNA helicase RuvB
VETIAASLSEQRDAIEDIIEPYLIQQALLQRTPRGRVLTRLGYEHLGLVAPKPTPARMAQIELLPPGSDDNNGEDDDAGSGDV